MEADKNLKELLLKGGLEKASSEFTNNVMKGIERVSISKPGYEPLVNEGFKRMFRITYLTITCLLIILSLLIKASELQYDLNIQLPTAYIKYTDQVIIYIVAFWTLVFLSRKLDKRNEHLLS